MISDCDIKLHHFLQTSDAFRNPTEGDDVSTVSSRIFSRTLSGRSAIVFVVGVAAALSSILTDLMRFDVDLKDLDDEDSLFRLFPAIAKI